MSRNLIVTLFVVVVALVACTGSDCDIDLEGGHGYYQPVYDYYIEPYYVEPVYYYEPEPVYYVDDCGWYCY